MTRDRWPVLGGARSSTCCGTGYTKAAITRRTAPTSSLPGAFLHTAIMSKGTKYLLVSLPTSISPSNHADDALTALRSTVTSDVGNTSPFAIPNFKIGTLDALVQQADDLAKLNAACEGVVAKVGDSLKTILDDEAKVEQQKTINDSASISSTMRECQAYEA
jgi:hypothetical protein